MISRTDSEMLRLARAYADAWRRYVEVRAGIRSSEDYATRCENLVRADIEAGEALRHLVDAARGMR